MSEKERQKERRIQKNLVKHFHPFEDLCKCSNCEMVFADVDMNNDECPYCGSEKWVDNQVVDIGSKTVKIDGIDFNVRKFV